MKELWQEIKRDKWWFLAEAVLFSIGMIIAIDKKYASYKIEICIPFWGQGRTKLEAIENVMNNSYYQLLGKNFVEADKIFRIHLRQLSKIDKYK